MEDSLEALKVADTKNQAAAATPTNSRLLSSDFCPNHRYWRGRDDRGQFNSDRGRTDGPRYHTRGHWNAVWTSDRKFTDCCMDS
jgi:hypothetical protein